MPCPICSAKIKCQHSVDQSVLRNFFGKEDSKKSSDNDGSMEPCGSGDTSSGKSPGLMKFVKKCFKSHFNKNPSSKFKPKMKKATSEPGVIPIFNKTSETDVTSVYPVVEENRPDEHFLESLNETLQRFIAVVEENKDKNPQLATNNISHNSTAEAEESRENLESENIPLTSQRSLAVELLNLSTYGWYWGPITVAEAVEKLTDEPDGSFLIRDSYANNYLVSMSFKALGKIYHTRINHSNGYFSFYHDPIQKCATIYELIEQSMDGSKNTILCYSNPRDPLAPTVPVRLTRPVSRFTEVRSLQYLCRFVIRQYIRVDQIKDLPLPNQLCDYIEAKHF